MCFAPYCFLYCGLARHFRVSWNHGGSFAQTTACSDRPVDSDERSEALSAAAEAPAAAEENRLRLSWEGGALTHNVQAYMRAASEGEQGLQTSPYAVVYNFTPKKTEDVMYLRDITDGEKADGTLIQLEFVSYSKKGVPSFRYAILPLA